MKLQSGYFWSQCKPKVGWVDYPERITLLMIAMHTRCKARAKLVMPIMKGINCLVPSRVCAFWIPFHWIVNSVASMNRTML
jgi:hypothetical protein